MFIKLQVEKNRHSGGLRVTINFDRNAPNFSFDEHDITWAPTVEELDFVIETYEMISKNNTRVQTSDLEIANTVTNNSVENKTEESSSEPVYKKKSNFGPLEGEIDIKEDSSDQVFEKKEEEKDIFVQADDKTIDDVIKRKSVKVGEALILDEGDKSIIDKMLKKREKNKDKSES